MEKLYAVVGPTAIGKSKVAIELAKRINGEVISMDSMQIYKYLNIGTAKIIPKEMEGIKHHMLDFVEPNENYSVADFVNKVKMIITDIIKRGKNPIIVGGTGLYLESLIYGYSFGNVDNKELRKSLEEEQIKIGNEAFYRKLVELDPVEAEKLHPNNAKRVLRAMEICLGDNINKSDKTDNKTLKYDLKIVLLNTDREYVYEKINQRVEIMFNNGLMQEVDYLINEKKLNFDMQSMLAIGYREFKDYYDNIINLDQLKDKIKQDTRRYAKRQLTWFKRYDFLKEFDIRKFSVEEIVHYLEE